MKVYISGKITDLQIEEAFKIFERAELIISANGYIPVNPMKVNKHTEGKTWEEYMLDDIRVLFDCEAIYMLDNWEESTGARIEYQIAKELGMQIIFEEEQNSDVV